MIATLKRSTLAALKHLGVSRHVARSRWRRERLLVLCYHGIALHDEHQWWPALYVSPEHLETRLRLLRQVGCTVLPLGEALERLYRHDLPERAVALTFDDGYYDFVARAVPLLRKYELPASVYLTTGRVDNSLPIANLFISYALWLSRDRTLDGRGIIGLDGESSLATAAERDAVLHRIVSAMQAQEMPESERDEWARRVVERLGLSYETLLASRVLTLMRPDEVARVSREGFDVQLHTHQHRTPQATDDFIRDVLKNRERIEAMTGRRPAHLCYPSGNYWPWYLPALRGIGVQSATTCDPGLADASSEPLLLPRFVDTGGMPTVIFEAWLTGVAARLPRRTTRGGFRPTGDSAHVARPMPNRA